MTTERPRIEIFLLRRQVSSLNTGDMKGAIDCSLSWLSLPTRFRQVKSYSLVNRWLSNKVVYIGYTWEAICDICDSNPSFFVSVLLNKRKGWWPFEEERLWFCNGGQNYLEHCEKTLPRNWYTELTAHNDNYLIGFSGIIPSTSPPPSPVPIPPALLCAQKKTHYSTRFVEKSTLIRVRVGTSLVLLLLLERSLHF